MSHGRRGDKIEVGIFDGRSGRPCFTAYGLFVHGRDSCHVDVEEKRERWDRDRKRERERAERKWRNVPQGLGLPPGRYLELSTRKSLVGVCVLTKSKNSHVPPVNSFVAAEG